MSAETGKLHSNILSRSSKRKEKKTITVADVKGDSSTNGSNIRDRHELRTIGLRIQVLVSDRWINVLGYEYGVIVIVISNSGSGNTDPEITEHQ